MRRFIFTQLLLLFAITWANGQSTEIIRFEKQVQNAYTKVYPATVKLIGLDSLGRDQGTGSGVVVNSDGLILTVAHVNVPGRRFRVVFPDGRKVFARGLGEVSSLDAGMMQIEEEGPFPYVSVGRSANLQKGEPCISLGYAGGLRSEDPALRLGFVVSVGEQGRRRNRLHTTCLMEPGDSGGPTFNMKGEVIGLRSSINQSLDDNYDIPIDVYLHYWDPMLAGEELGKTPGEEFRRTPRGQRGIPGEEQRRVR